MKHIVDIDNATLVEECKAGDREAMSLLYTRFAPRMLHVICRYVRNQEDAHDILHDGFIAAFTRLESLREPERVEYWLATIMKNLSLKFLQSQNVESILDEIPEEIEETSDINDVIDFATLESLITQLPDGYQKVFRLAVLENKSHKEISKILGIAPNSSSSQLFHAKVMLRRLIAEHKNKAALMTLLMLIAISVGVLFYFGKEDNAELDSMVISQNETGKRSATIGEPTAINHIVQDNDDHEEMEHHKRTKTQSPNVSSLSSDTCMSSSDEKLLDKEKEELESKEEDIQNLSDLDNRYKDKVAESTQDDEEKEVGIPYHKSSAHSRWSAGISVDVGMVSFDGFGGSGSDFANNIIPPYNPDDSQMPSEDEDKNIPRRIRAEDKAWTDQLKSWQRKHYLPITVGFTVEKHFVSWGAVETGLAYSYLHSDYENLNTDVTCHWHYLEIPLKVNLYAYQSDRLAIYGSVGGRVALPVYSNGAVHSRVNSILQNTGSLDPKPVWSVGVSVGVSYRISKRLNLFLEPSLQYHFPQDAKVPNIWTDDEPWSFSVPFGIRFSW